MISDDERRELAARLRETCDEIEREGNGLTVYELADVLNISEDCSGMVESLNLDDVRNLADLIDPTCRMEPEGEGFRCSACGTYHDMSGFDEFPWPRCPECGARVKGSNSLPLGGEGR